MRTYTRAEAHGLAGHFADDIVRRLFPTKSNLTTGDVTVVMVAAELRRQDVPLTQACRTAQIISGSAGSVSLTMDQLYRLAPAIGSGKFTRALSFPPANERHRTIEVSVAAIRDKMGGAP